MLELQYQHPELSLELTEATTDQLILKLREHQLDGALLATPPPGEDLDEIRLFKEPFWLAHPRDHHFYNKDEVSLSDLKDEKVLLLSEEHCLSEQIISACKIDSRDVSNPIPRLNASSLETLVQLVGMGLGVTLVPALSVHGGRLATDRVILREVGIPDAFREVRLVHRTTFPREAALKVFSDIICDVLPNTVT